MPKLTGRLTAVLTIAALATTGIALAGGQQAAAAVADTTPGYHVTSLTVPVMVGPNNDQACTIDADLYLPDGTSSSHKVPAILTTHGFGGDKADPNQAAIGKGFVGQGYAVLSYSGLGFGKTTCKIQMDDPSWDGKAGKQMVDVLAGKRAYTPSGSGTPRFLKSIATETVSDPRVGMIGGSPSRCRTRASTRSSRSSRGTTSTTPSRPDGSPRSSGSTCSSGPVSLRAPRTRVPTRSRCRAARTSPTRPASVPPT